MFERAFPAMLEGLEQLFAQAGYQEEDFTLLSQQFTRLRDCFKGRGRPGGDSIGEDLSSEAAQ